MLRKSGLLMRELSGWRYRSEGELGVWWAGRWQDVEPCVKAWMSNGVAAASQVLKKLEAHAALVIDSGDQALLAVDRVRSWPLFYSIDGSSAGNCPRTLESTVGRSSADSLALLEMRMAGYACEDRTAVKNIRQLRPGEHAVVNFKERVVQIRKHFFYLPSPDEHPAEDLNFWISELDNITDSVFRNTADAAGGYPIWIPLSGGLDSRLVLCKLHELGYRDLHTYSYGLHGNHEARIAKKVAQRLGVSWEFVPVTGAVCRNFFWSKERIDYWRFSDGLASVPILQDVAVLKTRTERGEIPKDAVFITGQSGDFLTGGHIPSQLLADDAGEEDLLQALIAKHFSLWRDEVQVQTNQNRLRESLLNFFTYCREVTTSSLSPAALYESWEWQERQSKYVVNQMRMYDYVNRSWLMPLWHGRYMDFWAKVPFALKLDQKLYRYHLENWNYKGLFKDYAPAVLRWPGMSIAFVPMAKIIGKLYGRKVQDKFYDYVRYFGHYAFAYGIFGWSYFGKRAERARGPVSLMSEAWLNEFFRERERERETTQRH